MRKVKLIITLNLHDAKEDCLLEDRIKNLLTAASYDVKSILKTYPPYGNDTKKN